MKYKELPSPHERPWVDETITLNRVRSELDRKYRSRAIDIHEGRNRCVYVMGAYVIKVPRNLNGVTDNDWEGSVYTSSDPGEWNVRYPNHKRLVFRDGIPILFMEYVEPAFSEQIIARLGAVPKWVDCVDCGQVGFNKHWLLVAYDYGPL